jgi:signal transduction histidine kinase
MCVGYLGETAHQRRRETAAITTLGREAWLNAGQGLLKSVLGPVLQLFGSTRALTILRGRASRIAVWRSELSPVSADLHTIISFEDPQRATFFSDASSEAWHVTRRVGNSLDVVMLDVHGARIRGAQPTPEITSFMAFFKCRSAISVPVYFRDAVIGRVFLFDPCIPLFERESAIQLGQRIASEIAPAAHNVFRLRRLRSRAEARERARIARELHDGLLQSISAAELRVDVVRRKIAKFAGDDAAELSRVQAALSGEVRGLRMLTRRMQASSSAPNDLQQTLREVMSRFERETGIAVRFETDFDVNVTSRTRHEIVRIVQEGLTNIRKHSGARHVMVRLASLGGSVRLVIEDDGRGFSFSGNRSQRELDVMCAGPLTIRERVRALRGELNVVSMPGKGARLHVKVPAAP